MLTDEISFPKIDWEALYQHPWYANGSSETEKNQANFWSGRAGDFARKAHHPGQRHHANALLNRFSWGENERVLDVGAGPGTFAIPLSQRVAQVTAFDVSAEMLAKLREQAEREARPNIETRCGRWLSPDSNRLGDFDTVICFNALGVVAMQEDGTSHMGRAIDRLRDCARRGMVLVPHADHPVDKPMRVALNLPERTVRRQRIAVLYHIMVDRGLLPNLEILHRPFFWTFQNQDEATDVLGHRLGLIGDQERMNRLAKHLKERLEWDGKAFKLEYPVSQALFTWNQDDA